MAKRGETRPWRVTYKWQESGIKGTVACSNRDEAEFKAAEIRRNGVNRDMRVDVTVAHRDAPK